MSTQALISMGSNLSDRESNLDFAVASLAKTPGIDLRAVSSRHSTSPVGGPADQGAYLNAACSLDCTLDPDDLLKTLLSIEHQAGRVRKTRWEARPLDLDLLLYGQNIIESPHLTVPHPRMTVRRFVLAPLAEIAPDSIEPITGLSIAALLSNLDRRPSYVALYSQRDDKEAIFSRLVSRLGAIGLVSGIGSDAVKTTSHSERKVNRGTDLQVQENAEETKIRTDLWYEELWGNRWIVTDFWFDVLSGPALLHIAGSENAMILRQFPELRTQVIWPTFLVFDRHTRFQQIKDWFTENETRGGRPVPILRPDSDDTDEFVSDIVAACQATRTG